MTSTPEWMSDLEREITAWRIQDNIALPFFTLYLHYCFSTVEEEFARVHPQKRWAAKIIFYLLRYGTILYIILDLPTSYRTYLRISPMICKVFWILNTSIKKLIAVTADVTMGLCVSALLGARQMYFITIILLCSTLPLVSLGIQLQGYIRIPAEPTSVVDDELGYPCYIPDAETQKATLPGGSLGIFAYLDFARASCRLRPLPAPTSKYTSDNWRGPLVLALLATIAALSSYKANGGRLLTVIGREGGMYYLTAAGVRLFAAIVNTPGVTKPGEMVFSSLMVTVNGLQNLIIPILAQRLLLNIRGETESRPRSMASTFLLNPPEHNRRMDYSCDESGLG